MFEGSQVSTAILSRQRLHGRQLKDYYSRKANSLLTVADIQQELQKCTIYYYYFFYTHINL